MSHSEDYAKLSGCVLPFVGYVLSCVSQCSEGSDS